MGTSVYELKEKSLLHDLYVEVFGDELSSKITEESSLDDKLKVQIGKLNAIKACPDYEGCTNDTQKANVENRLKKIEPIVG